MSESAQTPQITCEVFESTLGDFLEGGLTERERELAEQHLSGCAICQALVSDLDQIVQAAAVLPPLAPTRDLWPDIQSRLEPSVTVLPVRQTPALQTRNLSWRTLAAAAALLVTASAGVTWTLAHNTSAGVEVPTLASNNDAVGGSDAAADQLTDNRATMAESASRSDNPSADAPATDQITLRDRRVLAGGNGSANPGTSLERAAAAGESRSTNNTAPQLIAVASTERMMALDTLYGREIATLRSVAESQLGMLDSNTVNVVRRNLDIIDKAILESRAALENDPNSRFLLEQLDRAYERKVDLLRRLALL